MEPHRKLLGLAAGPPIKHVPGRLAHEVSTDKGKVLAEIAVAITRAYATIGLHADGLKIKETTELSVKKILEIYPSAMIADICKAIEMAAFGQIKIEDQLTTISAGNIFQWYKILRTQHGDKLSIPFFPSESKIPEPSESEKKTTPN